MSQKEIGPSFFAEIVAANLNGLPFSWCEDGTLTFSDSMTAAQIAAVEAVYAAHDPLAIPASAQAQSAIAAGLTVASTSTPALNATYPIDHVTQTKISSVETFIEKNGSFPGSTGTSLAWYDIAGVAHVFPSVALFSEFATAIANYVADLDLYGAGAPGVSLPAASVTIA